MKELEETKDDTKIVPFYAVVLITSVINTFFFSKIFKISLIYI